MTWTRLNTGLIALAAVVHFGCGDSGTDPMDAPPRHLPADVCLIDGCECNSAGDEDAIAPVPESGELGHWAAAHIPLTEKPFEVTGVVLGLASPRSGSMREHCNPLTMTEVQLFISDSSTPPVEPAPLRTLTPDPNMVNTDEAVSFITMTLMDPLRIEEGQELFVSIKMDGTPEQFICLYSCDMTTDAESRGSWWSQTPDPPYNWASLGDWGPWGYQIGINGHVVAP